MGDSHALSSSPSRCSEERNVYHLLIFNSNSQKFLALREPFEELQLPVVTPPTSEVWQWELDCDSLGRMVEKEFGVEGIVLGPLWERQDPDPDAAEELMLVFDVVHVLCSKELDRMTWISKEDIRNGLWKSIHSHGDTEQMLLNFFHTEVFWQANSSRPIWRTIGWFRCLKEWICGRLASHGYHVASIHYVRNTETSAVMAVEAFEGKLSLKQRFYVKTNAQGSREAIFTEKIAKFAKEYVPKIVAVNETWNSFLQWNAGGLHFQPNPVALLTALARLQKMSSLHLEDLKQSGMHVYSVKWVIANVDKVLRDVATKHNGRTRKEQLVLGKRISSIQCLCEELEAEGFPITLVHGDLHLENIAIRRHTRDVAPSYCFFDWGSAFLGHPLLDVYVLLNSIETEMDKDKALEQYMKISGRRASLAHLKRMVHIAGLCYWFIDLYISLQKYNEALNGEHIHLPNADEQLIRVIRVLQNIEKTEC